MPSPDATRERVWLNVDIPRDVNEELAVRSQRLHRSARGQVRLLIEQFVEQESQRRDAHADRARVA